MTGLRKLHHPGLRCKLILFINRLPRLPSKLRGAQEPYRFNDGRDGTEQEGVQFVCPVDNAEERCLERHFGLSCHIASATALCSLARSREVSSEGSSTAEQMLPEEEPWWTRSVPVYNHHMAGHEWPRSPAVQLAAL